MENKILKIGYIGFRIALYATYLAIAVFTLFAIYLLINPGEALPSWLKISETGITVSTSTAEVISSLSQTEIHHLLLILAKLIVMWVVTSFILKRFIQVIKSVNIKDTFRLLNIHNFRRIGSYFFVLSIIDIFNISGNLSDNSIKLVIEPLYILCTITAFILAEVFREGNKLSEENKLTI